MRRSIFLGIVLTLASGVGIAAAPEVGQPLGEFRVRTLDGRELTPQTLRGKVLVVNFWASWCAPCKAEMPELDAFYRRHSARGVEMVAVSVDDRASLPAVRRMVEGLAFPVALAVDSDIRAFGRIRQVPATFVVDGKGVVRRSGWSEAGIVDMPTLERSVGPLLEAAGKGGQ